MSRPLRICIVAPYDLAEEGGVKRHSEHLAEQLRAVGDEVVVVGPYSGSLALPKGVCGLRGVLEVKSNGSNSRPGILVSPWAVRRLLRKRFDVLHVMEPVVPSLSWYAAWFGGSAVRVATFHAFSENERRVSRFFRRGLGRLQCALFDRAIAVSPSAARYARALWSRPLTLIPNGIDTRLFTPGSSARSDGVRLLFVGQWHNPRKGLPTLLHALMLLRARGFSVTLDVIGDGHGQTPEAVPGVTYHAPLSDERILAERYRAADIFVAPSLGMESFGIVLLEAMASGRPIICSDIEGYRSVLAAGGARVVPPSDAEALAAQIAEVSASRVLRWRMGDINRAASLAYDWSQIAARVRREYLSAQITARAV